MLAAVVIKQESECGARQLASLDEMHPFDVVVVVVVLNAEVGQDES